MSGSANAAMTQNFLNMLMRNLGGLEKEALHIYFKKLPVAFHDNCESLLELPEPEFVFDAVHANETRGMNWPGSPVLHLRRGCPVILVWNLNDQLKNSSKGVFLDCSGEGLKVFFPQVGSVEIERHSWFKTNKQGNVVGSICQYPLVLAYAATCHKAQGPTLPAPVVHCSNEFVSGLTYVALSRVKDPGHLQVLNFKRHFLQPPNPRVKDECSTDLGHLRDDLQCCRNKILPAHFFTVQDRYMLEETDGEEIVFPVSSHTIVCSCSVLL